VLVLLVAVACGLAGVAVRQVDGPVEGMAVDARFAVRGHRPPSPSVVVVAFDNQTLRRLNVRPPPPRDDQAKVIDRLDLAGARVVALDFSLEQPSWSARQDWAVVRVLLDARNAVVSVVAPDVAGDVADLAGREGFAGIHLRPGFTGLQPDRQGVVRRFRASAKSLDTFAVAAAEEFTGARHIVAPASGLIDYPGPTGTFPTLSYVDVLEGHFEPSAVRGKIVVVGPTATVFQDRHRIPVDSTMPGPEIHAAAISTVLAGFPLRSVTEAVAQRTAFAAGFAVPLLLLGVALVTRRLRIVRGGGGVLLDAPGPLAAATVGAAAFAGWCVAAQLAFDRGTVVELLPGLTAITASTAAAAAVAAIVTTRERQNVRQRFAASEPGIVQQVLASPGRRRAVAASDVVAGYTIEGWIAGGGMGEVYRAIQARLGREVALKLIRNEHALDRDYRRRFVDEAHRAAGISHPNVIPVIDAGEAEGVLFIAMALIEGTDLADSLKNVHHLDAAYAVRLIHRVACAVDAAHARDVFHRDLKPANILIPDRSPQHPFLTDFGVAKGSDEAGTPGGVEGTIAYLAPERLEGRESGRAADVYALAAVLYECLAGTAPFPRATREEIGEAHRSADRPAVTAVRTELPAAIDTVIATAMAIDPGARHPSATAFTRAAAEALGVELTDDEPAAAVSRGHEPRAIGAPLADDVAPTELS
jgi:CHASE2 domain-containing sensor protein